MDMHIIGQQFGHVTLSIFFVCQIVGDVYLPIRERLIESLNPKADTAFSGVYLLAASYKAYDCGPVFMLVKRPYQELTLRHREVGNAFFPCKPCTEVPHIPHTLGFVEDGHIFHFGGVAFGRR